MRIFPHIIFSVGFGLPSSETGADRFTALSCVYYSIYYSADLRKRFEFAKNPLFLCVLILTRSGQSHSARYEPATTMSVFLVSLFIKVVFIVNSDYINGFYSVE